MKIDIHTHTKRCKKGEAATTEISPKEFCERVSSTDVKIIAITNHNVFDLEQYDEILQHMDTGVQVWPGIELDIVDGESKGHLLAIVSPERANQFHEKVAKLTGASSPDDFSTSVQQVLASFDALGPLYVAHYRQKRPNLSEEALTALETGTRAPSRVLKEVTNSISAGIYISHGYASIYGSDVHDWATYEEHARDLPDLRLPVDSFEHFCLLLEKDATTINTVLDRKTPEELVLQPFEDETFLKLTFYNDINVVFGAKGTGKSCILEALAKHYSSHGIDARVFKPASDRLDEIFDLKGKDLQVNLTNHGITDCADEVEALRNTKEEDVTGLSKYTRYYSAKTTNRNAKRIRLKDLDTEEDGVERREFERFVGAAKTTSEFLEYVRANDAVNEVLGDSELQELDRLLSELVDSLQVRVWKSFSAWKEIELLNAAIGTFRLEVARKTGNPAKPTTTGFGPYAANRCTIERNAASIVEALTTTIPAESESIGNLGENKGELALRTELQFQDGGVWDASFTPVARVKKSTQKDFAAEVRKIRDRAYRDDLFECISRLNEIQEVETVKSLKELLLFKRYFALEGQPYVPSSGEASMVMLEKELRRDADIYILDEPERSLGNEYISEVIVPLIRGHALAGKKVFISTHDANIAVRTLPYCSVYRAHGIAGYDTYIGNPFSNNLMNVEDATDTLDWRLISMRTLEGGKEAFGERGKIYGNA